MNIGKIHHDFSSARNVIEITYTLMLKLIIEVMKQKDLNIRNAILCPFILNHKLSVE